MTDIDVESVDHALATTRAVRLRLDLDRPVADQIIRDCIDVAEQAPSGGNQGSRRWMVVRDQTFKNRIAELYMATGGEFMINSHERLEGTGHPQEKVMRSAAHLARHLAEVPAIVIPTIIGRHDASGRPGLFDSVIQSVWSFCVALRARGLGTSWTTAILQREEDLAELLGIPAGNTPIAMIPVAWTTGTDFSRARRHPAEHITFYDHYGHTYRSGPSSQPTLDNVPGIVVETDVKARAGDMRPLLASKSLLSFQSTASNPNGPYEVGQTITTLIDDATSTVTVADSDTLQWQHHSDMDVIETWTLRFESLAGSTRLRLSYELSPGTSPATSATQIATLLEHHRRNAQQFIDTLATAATERASNR